LGNLIWMAWHPFDAAIHTRKRRRLFRSLDSKCCDAKLRIAAGRHMSETDNSIDRH
jgi:hypothetical protein